MSKQRLRYPRQKTVKGGKKGPLLWVVLVLGLIAVLGVLLAITRLGNTKENTPEAQTTTDQGPLLVGVLELSQTSVDLGRVALGQWVRPTFRLRNAGDSPVTVTVDERNISTLEGC